MKAGAVSQTFIRLRVRSIGLPQVLFQSITHMAAIETVAGDGAVATGPA
ncbi:MAG TPA: hypothetical protein VF025_13615 [Gaiellaceae bacterium]